MRVNAADKRLNAMDRLADMGHFPVAVNAGATLNVLMTVSLTWWLVPRFPQPFAPVLWVALVLCLNLLPVILLRLTLQPATEYPTLRTMNFVRDQHKFSDWVYVAASANMAVWVLGSWAVFSVVHTPAALALVLAVAFPRHICTGAAADRSALVVSHCRSTFRSVAALRRWERRPPVRNDRLTIARPSVCGGVPAFLGRRWLQSTTARSPRPAASAAHRRR